MRDNFRSGGTSPLLVARVDSWLKMSPQPELGAEIVRQAVARAAERVSRRLEEGALAEVCDDVLSRPRQQRSFLARNSTRAGRLEVCWELIRRAETLRFSDAARMRRVAEAAVELADALPREAAPAALIEDARAEAHACLANSLRINGELLHAEEAWPRAERHLAAGTGDPLLAAKLAQYKGSLRVDQHRPEEAATLFREAYAAYARLGERELAGRAAIALGIAHRKLGRFGEAIRSTLEAGRLVSRGTDVALPLIAMQNLVHYLHDAGFNEHAAGLLERIRDLVEENAGNLTLLRLRFLEGKIAAGLGKQVEARAALNAVRREFLAKGMLYDAALVALELAALYAEAGWTFEVEKLAEEMYPVFISRELPREASATLLLFVDAVNRRAATADLIRSLAADLNSKRERKG